MASATCLLIGVVRLIMESLPTRSCRTVPPETYHYQFSPNEYGSHRQQESLANFSVKVKAFFPCSICGLITRWGRSGISLPCPPHWYCRAGTEIQFVKNGLECPASCYMQSPRHVRAPEIGGMTERNLRYKLQKLGIK